MSAGITRPAAETFDIHDHSLAADPYTTYAWMRKHCPVGRSEKHGGFWFLSKYDDIAEVCRHPAMFSSNPVPIPADFGRTRPMIPLEADPPDHGEYRKILAPVFSPSAAAGLEGEIRQTVTTLIDRFVERGRCDLIAELAAQLPTIVFLQFMQWPLADAPKFLEWADRILRGDKSSMEDTAAQERAGAELYGYFGEMIAARRESPTDDFLSYLLRASFASERPLSDFEILDIVFNLLAAGVDTTTAAIGNIFDHLSRHPLQRDRLAMDPAMIPNAIEEFLRWESLATSGRTVLHDVTVRGVHMRPGDRVMLLFGSASRDEDVFEMAEELDFTRTPNRHVAFGSGPHRCLGSHIARVELRVVLEEVHRRIPDYRLADDAAVPKQLGYVKGVLALPIVFSPGHRSTAAPPAE